MRDGTRDSALLDAASRRKSRPRSGRVYRDHRAPTIFAADAPPASGPRRVIPPLLQPSLDPLWERGILIRAVGTPVEEGDIAVLEVAELIARGEPLSGVACEKVQSVSKGCQVLKRAIGLSSRLSSSAG
jgi:hypothetical protein